MDKTAYLHHIGDLNRQSTHRFSREGLQIIDPPFRQDFLARNIPISAQRESCLSKGPFGLDSPAVPIDIFNLFSSNKANNRCSLIYPEA